MTDQQVVEIIEREFRDKTLGATEQYLEIHQPIYINDKLKVDRIDRDNKYELIIAYLPVYNEKFYFAVYIDKKTSEITSIGTEPYHRVYFIATSESLTAEELKTMTILSPTEVWNLGDFRTNRKRKYNYSGIKFLVNPEPDEFEDKLNKLLDFLDQDEKGIRKLVQKANGYIQVAMDIHNGNTIIGGPYLNANTIKRMGNLGLSIDFDLYTAGNCFKS